MWEQLIDVLSELTIVYQKLFCLSKEKRGVLIAVRMKELERIVQEEQVLLSIVVKLEQERAAVIQRLAKQHGFTVFPQKLEEILPYCDKTVLEKFLRAHKKLKKVIADVKAYNQVNTNLTRQALEIVDYKLNVLSAASIGPTYAEKGQEQVTRAKRLDYKA